MSASALKNEGRKEEGQETNRGGSQNRPIRYHKNKQALAIKYGYATIQNETWTDSLTLGPKGLLMYLIGIAQTEERQNKPEKYRFKCSVRNIRSSMLNDYKKQIEAGKDLGVDVGPLDKPPSLATIESYLQKLEARGYLYREPLGAKYNKNAKRPDTPYLYHVYEISIYTEKLLEAKALKMGMSAEEKTRFEAEMFGIPD